MTDEQNIETETETTRVEDGDGNVVEETTETRTEPSEGYKDESPAQPVEDQSADTVAQENPSTPAQEVVDEVHEQQAENSGQVESD